MSRRQCYVAAASHHTVACPLRPPSCPSAPLALQGVWPDAVAVIMISEYRCVQFLPCLISVPRSRNAARTVAELAVLWIAD